MSWRYAGAAAAGFLAGALFGGATIEHIIALLQLVLVVALLSFLFPMIIDMIRALRG